MRIKILYIDVPLAPPGGGQISLFNILRNLDSRKFEIRVFVPSGCGFAELLKNNGIAVDAATLSGLTAGIRKYCPDLIHCNSSTSKYTLFAALSAKILGIPFIWHNRVIASAGWKERVIARLSDKIVVISDAVGVKFDWCAAKVVKIYNAVDTCEYAPGLETVSVRESLGLPRDGRVVGMFSRLELWKGHELFLNAASRLVKSGLASDCRFLVVGEGPDKVRITSMAKEAGLADRVMFTGFRDDIPQLMNLCDVVVNPSIEPEPFGRTIIEAMSCAKPVIATNIGGPREIIDSGIDGLLVEPAPEALCAAMLKLLEKGSGQAVDMGVMARKKVLAMFDVRVQVREIEAVYGTVCRKSGQ